MTNHLTEEDIREIRGRYRYHSPMRDPQLLAQARTDIPRLLDEVERLRSKNARLSAAIDHGQENCDAIWADHQETIDSLIEERDRYASSLENISREVFKIAHGDVEPHVGLQLIHDKIGDALEDTDETP